MCASLRKLFGLLSTDLKEVRHGSHVSMREKAFLAKGTSSKACRHVAGGFEKLQRGQSDPEE